MAMVAVGRGWFRSLSGIKGQAGVARYLRLDLAAQGQAPALGFHHCAPFDPRFALRAFRGGAGWGCLAQHELLALVAYELRVAFDLELGSVGQLESDAMGVHVLIIAYVSKKVYRLWISRE